MRFNFVGEVSVADLTADRPGIRKGTTKTGAEYKSLNMSVADKVNNRAYAECFGMVYDKVNTYDTDNKKIEINWGDRFDKEVIDSVANYRKHTISLNGTRHEFITEIDFINFIEENIDEINGKKFTVTGQTSPNVYEGNITRRFTIQNMYEADEDAKSQLRLTGEFFFNKESIDGTSFADEKKIYVNGYTRDYVNKDNGQKYIPMQGVLDCSKIDFDNEKHIKLLNFKLGMLGINPIASESDKIKTKLKNSDYYKLMVEFNYVNGAVEVDFDESQLTDMQKEMVELGMKKVEDFRPAGQTFGQRVTMFKIINFDLRNDYVDGMVQVDKASDFEEEIYSPEVSVGSIEEIETEAEDDEDDDLDLFS